MKETSHDPPIDPELEARIVAMMLGEASDFERDQLNRLIEQCPELATFKEQIQRVHGLLQDVGTGESVAQDDDWKLSAEKRNKVLAVIRSEPEQQPASDVLSITAQNGPMKQNSFWSYSKVAAVLCLVGSLGVLLLLVSANRLRAKLPRGELWRACQILNIGSRRRSRFLTRPLLLASPQPNHPNDLPSMKRNPVQSTKQSSVKQPQNMTMSRSQKRPFPASAGRWMLIKLYRALTT